jgi:type IV pilus assembly protein PilN
MIRVNLLAGERRPLKVTRSLERGRRVSLAGCALLITAALLGSWRYRTISQRDSRLAGEIEAARREEARLTEVLKQGTEVEAQRAQLQQRVTLIDELRRGQTTPVHIIDQISRSLPDLTWLTSLRQDGDDVTLEGQCQSLTALADFVRNLESTRYFKRPVEIVTSEVAAGQNGTDLIRFTIKGTLRMTGGGGTVD